MSKIARQAAAKRMAEISWAPPKQYRGKKDNRVPSHNRENARRAGQQARRMA